jgi:MFS family permease
MTERNIRLAYALCILRNTWFWLWVWVFYYLLYTNYAGIGLIETGLFLTITLLEIPTGAIADLLGKKPTLILSFLMHTIGAFITAFAPNYPTLLFSILILGIGGSLFSGTFEALIYDSLKQEKQEEKYHKIIANMTTLRLVTPAVCGLIGGFLYAISPNLPFIANAITYGIGFVLSFFLIEPLIDTEKFSLKSFIKQTKEGIRELTKTTTIREQTFLLLSIAVIVVIGDEMLNSFLGVEFGFTATQLGILWAIIYVFSGIASQFSSNISHTFKGNKGAILIGCVYAITLVISPVVGLVFGALSLLVRTSVQAIFMNISSVIINNNTESRYRATTLSTFNMFTNIPYMLTAYGVGVLADMYSAKIVGFGLGVVIVILLMLHTMSKKKNQRSGP